MTGPSGRSPTGPPEAHPGAADDARDVGPAVEQRGQVAGGVGDIHGQDRVPLDRPDLHRADPALDRGPPRLHQRSDRGGPGGRRGPVVAGLITGGRGRGWLVRPVPPPAQHPAQPGRSVEDRGQPGRRVRVGAGRTAVGACPGPLGPHGGLVAPGSVALRILAGGFPPCVVPARDLGRIGRGAATAAARSPLAASSASPWMCVLPAAVRSACAIWRACSTCSLLCTSNGTMVAAACGIRLTTAAILSAVRSCSSRPSSGE